LSEEEIFDVVNCSDEVIGRAPRAVVHANGLRHRSVHILVFNIAGELYIQRRSLDKDSAPGLWDTSAAGHVESGEGYIAAGGRELHEELGLDQNTALTPLFKLAPSVATGFEFVWVYRCIATTTLIPDPIEILDGRWSGLGQLAEWMSSDPSNFTATFHEICGQLKYYPG
jgi:isopentenyl-diphosphate delta-isomerase